MPASRGSCGRTRSKTSRTACTTPLCGRLVLAPCPSAIIALIMMLHESRRRNATGISRTGCCACALISACPHNCHTGRRQGHRALLL